MKRAFQCEKKEEGMKAHGREVVFKALSGSINRNLNDENSDRDIKLFVLPTFDDLYSGVVYKNFTTSETEDVEIHDVRKLEKLLYNSNLTFLELLYSVEIETFSINEINKIVEMRDDISRINLKNLYNSCYGMYHGQMKDLKNPNSEIQRKIINEYGYNTKKAMMSLHFLKFIIRFCETGFTDFASSIYYSGTEREFMMSIKQGKFTYGEFFELIKYTEQQVEELEPRYVIHTANEETNKKLQDLLRTLVRSSL